ncbi:stalk domain-containing protein [Paenibacillus brevis]|uniref:Copper amine oxidase N-terminal domain-containing protein n=1 Tax=Paenibacillus brevis TaxID=2841508 RepID=A0ABS6FUN9_9BACL|nr:stalk domain-containing protein [Paenibacillus brevis]MBU5673829.1 copper amine oxidase N-terminal domain-containing protein [Paenibacillus brevis]
MKKIILSLAACVLLGTATVAAAAPVATSVKASIRYFSFIVNGQPKLSADTLVHNGFTYVPIREAANLFNYDTKYDGATKSISFESRKEWITLTELIAANSTLSVSKQENAPDIYEIHERSQLAFKINVTSLKDGDNSTTADNKSNVIAIKKDLGSLFLNKKDVLEAGYKIE